MKIIEKINNSKNAVIKSGQYKDPGAKLYDEIIDSSYYKGGVIPEDADKLKDMIKSKDHIDGVSLLKEVYLTCNDDNKNSPYGRTPFSQSGCKYPHHVIKGDELVLSIPLIKHAYLQLWKEGAFTDRAGKLSKPVSSELKAMRRHLENHMKEIGLKMEWHHGQMCWFESSEIEDPNVVIKENFDDIFLYIMEETGINLFDNYDVFEEKSHSKLKYDFRKVYDFDTGHGLKLVYSLNEINIDNIGNGFIGHKATPKERQQAISDIQKNIDKKGNSDHLSSNQKLLAIIDRVTGKHLQSARVIGPFAPSVNNGEIEIYDIKRLQSYYNSKGEEFINKYVKTLKVGEIDNSSTFKATHWFKNSEAREKIKLRGGKSYETITDNTILRGQAAEGLKYGRGAKMNDLKGTFRPGDTPSYNHPSKKDIKRNPELYNESVYDLSDNELLEYFDEEFDEFLSEIELDDYFTESSNNHGVEEFKKRWKYNEQNKTIKFEDKEYKMDIDSDIDTFKFTYKIFGKEESEDQKKSLAAAINTPNGPIIVVNSDFWNYPSDHQDAIILHEIGHIVCQMSPKPFPKSVKELIQRIKKAIQRLIARVRMIKYVKGVHDNGFNELEADIWAAKNSSPEIVKSMIKNVSINEIKNKLPELEEALRKKYSKKTLREIYERDPKKNTMTFEEFSDKYIKLVAQKAFIDMVKDPKKVIEVRQRTNALNDQKLYNSKYFYKESAETSSLNGDNTHLTSKIWKEVGGKTPEHLYKWMYNNISYQKDIKKWKLKSPEELYKTKTGICHDQSFFSSLLLHSLGYVCGQIFFVECAMAADNPDGNAHTLTWYRETIEVIEGDGDKGQHFNYYWFETAWENQLGIHGPYDNMDELKHAIIDAYNSDNDINSHNPEYQTLAMGDVSNYRIGMSFSKYINSWETKEVQMTDNCKIVFRVTSNDIDIYEMLRKRSSAENWKKMIKSEAFTWLPRPEKYPKNGKSYFTKDGIDKYNELMAPIVDKVIGNNVKLEEVNTSDLRGIVYRDKYQIIVDTDKAINESLDVLDQLINDEYSIESDNIIITESYDLNNLPDILYFSSPTKLNSKTISAKSPRGLFLSPYIGISSIFVIDRFKEVRTFLNEILAKNDRELDNANYNVDYDEWYLSDDQLMKPLQKVHMHHNIPEFKEIKTGTSTGFIYAIDISSVKNELQMFITNDANREVIYKGSSKLPIKEVIQHTIQWEISYKASKESGKGTFESKPLKESTEMLYECGFHEGVGINGDDLEWIQNYLAEEGESFESPDYITEKSFRNGNKRRYLYKEFIEYAKSIKSKNKFNTMYDSDAFEKTYSFVPYSMRFFYRVADPTLCVIDDNGDDLVFFPLSELERLNDGYNQLDEMMIFAATLGDFRVLNIDDNKVYLAVEQNDKIILQQVLASSFDMYIQKIIGKDDIL